MGLKDLKQNQSKPRTAIDQQALEFIGGAALGTPAASNRRPSKPITYRRTSFSLTDEINQQINQISLLSRDFRVTRSDVVRAGVIALCGLDEEKLLHVLREAVQGADGEENCLEQ